MLECWDARVLGCWSDEMLRCWDAGVLGWWDAGVLGWTDDAPVFSRLLFSNLFQLQPVCLLGQKVRTFTNCKFNIFILKKNIELTVCKCAYFLIASVSIIPTFCKLVLFPVLLSSISIMYILGRIFPSLRIWSESSLKLSAFVYLYILWYFVAKILDIKKWMRRALQKLGTCSLFYYLVVFSHPARIWIGLGWGGL